MRSILHSRHSRHTPPTVSHPQKLPPLSAPPPSAHRPRPKPRRAARLRHTLVSATRPTASTAPGSLTAQGKEGSGDCALGFTFAYPDTSASLRCRKRNARLTCKLPIGFTSCADTPLCSLSRPFRAPLAAPTSTPCASPSPPAADRKRCRACEHPPRSCSHARRASYRTSPLHIPLPKSGGEPKQAAGRWGVFADSS